MQAQHDELPMQITKKEQKLYAAVAMQHLISINLCRCARLLKQHALSPFAIPAGLGPTVQCCTLALMYCAALETTHSLMLSPRLTNLLWPTCEQVSHTMHN